MSLTVKTDDITKGRKDLDPHGQFRGKWVNELHYVSSVPDKTGKNKRKLTYLKREILETDDQKETRLAKRRKSYENDDQSQKTKSL